MSISQLVMPIANPKHIVIVAGEESGDQHAAELVRQLKTQPHNLRFSAVGGRHLQAEGIPLISDLARYGVTGLTEVFRHLRILRKAFQDTQAYLLQHKPDLLILVDSPGFNLRIAKFAKRHGIRVLYYISPQIWAWKANRINTIRKNVDRMAVILPFEKAIYEKAEVPVSFVGHPLMAHFQTNELEPNAREALNLPNTKRIIALLPGSRTHEIERHMPVLMDTAQRLFEQHPDLHFVIPIAGTLDPSAIQAFVTPTNLPFTLIQGKALDVAACSDCIIVASGTASLECALLEKPMCIIYKISPLSYILGCHFVKIRYIALCNILQNRMIVPEFLQSDCNAFELTRLTNQLLENGSLTKSMRKNLLHLKQSLSAEKADLTISELVLQELSLSNSCLESEPRP